MSERKPFPVIAGGNQNLCPVCGERSYSAAGMHPQCGQQQADAARKKEIAAEKTAEENSPEEAPSLQRSWKKKCPKCDAELHVRKKICSCGHNFFGR